MPVGSPTSAMSIFPSAGSRARIPCSPMHSSSAEMASTRLKGSSRVRKVRNVCIRLTAEAPASLLPRPYSRSPSMTGANGSRVYEAAGRTVSWCEFSSRVGRAGSNPSDRAQTLFASRSGAAPCSARYPKISSAVRASSRESDGVAISLFNSPMASVVFVSIILSPFRCRSAGCPNA